MNDCCFNVAGWYLVKCDFSKWVTCFFLFIKICKNVIISLYGKLEMVTSQHYLHTVSFIHNIKIIVKPGEMWQLFRYFNLLFTAIVSPPARHRHGVTTEHRRYVTAIMALTPATDSLVKEKRNRATEVLLVTPLLKWLCQRFIKFSPLMLLFFGQSSRRLFIPPTVHCGKTGSSVDT